MGAYGDLRLADGAHSSVDREMILGRFLALFLCLPHLAVRAVDRNYAVHPRRGPAACVDCLAKEVNCFGNCKDLPSSIKAI
jgi:hypothetical protein